MRGACTGEVRKKGEAAQRRAREEEAEQGEEKAQRWSEQPAAFPVDGLLGQVAPPTQPDRRPRLGLQPPPPPRPGKLDTALPRPSPPPVHHPLRSHTHPQGSLPPDERRDGHRGPPRRLHSGSDPKINETPDQMQARRGKAGRGAVRVGGGRGGECRGEGATDGERGRAGRASRLRYDRNRNICCSWQRRMQVPPPLRRFTAEEWVGEGEGKGRGQRRRGCGQAPPSWHGQR